MIYFFFYFFKYHRDKLHDDWILVVRVGSSLPDCYGNLVSAGKYCQYNAVTLYYDYVMILQ